MCQFDQATVLNVVTALNLSNFLNTTPIDGNIIDTNGFEALTFEMYCGSYSTGTVTGVVWESNNSDMSGATIVDPEFLIGNPADFEVSGVQATAKIGYVGKLRYVQVIFTGSNTPDLTVSATAILGEPYTAPVGQAF